MCLCSAFGLGGGKPDPVSTAAAHRDLLSFQFPVACCGTPVNLTNSQSTAMISYMPPRLYAKNMGDESLAASTTTHSMVDR